MKKYSIHLCGRDKQDCEDIEVHADSPQQAEQVALDTHPEFEACRAQSEWNDTKQDWENYE